MSDHDREFRKNRRKRDGNYPVHPFLHPMFGRGWARTGNVIKLFPSPLVLAPRGLTRFRYYAILAGISLFFLSLIVGCIYLLGTLPS